MLSSVRTASLDPYGNTTGFFGQQDQMSTDIFGNSFDPNVVQFIFYHKNLKQGNFQFSQDYAQDDYNDYMKQPKNEDFNSLSDKCQYLEESLKHTRQQADMWRMRFEGEFMEKNRLLAERSNLLGQIEQMKHQMPQSPFMPPVQMGSPLSISLPQDNYDGGIRPSASLQHSPPYNIFGVSLSIIKYFIQQKNLVIG